MTDHLRDRLYGAAVGLAKTCNNNSKTENTTGLIIRALSVFGNLQTDDTELENMISCLHAEKNRISPDCASCLNPCGNTDDMDMHWMYMTTEKSVLEIKLKIMERIAALAVIFRNKALNDSNADASIFYKALEMSSYDLSEDMMEGLLAEVEQKIKENE